MESRHTLAIGTTKGLFILSSVSGRSEWALSGPHCDGWSINHVAADAATGRIWAVGGGEWTGAGVWCSTDGGASWSVSMLANGKREGFIAENPEFAAQIGLQPSPPGRYNGEIDALWSIARAGNTLYTGAKPASLYRSTDDGASWEPVTALNAHESRSSWEPGGAGLTLHTIVVDPDDPARLWVGISAAGVFASEDGGASWERRNRLSNAGVVDHSDHHHGHGHGDEHHELGHCVHNMVRAGGTGDLMYQQNHHGVFRSRDGGRSWQDVSRGLPSTFGFPIAVHPRNPDKIWVLPLNGDTQGRYPPGASAAVWTSSDGGDSWSARQNGLPVKNCFFTVLRQAMTIDHAEPAGVYFGTNTGSIFASTDEGESWQEIAEHLPTVLCVEQFDRT